MAWYDFITEGIANTGKDLLTVGKNIIDPRNIAQTALLTALSGGNKGDYLRNAGIGGLLNTLTPQQQNAKAKTRRSQAQAGPKGQFQNKLGIPKLNPQTGQLETQISNEGISGLRDGFQPAAFTEGEMIDPIKTGGIIDLFQGGNNNAPNSGGVMNRVRESEDYEIRDKNTGRLLGYERVFDNGAIQQLDANQNFVAMIQKGSTKPANFNIGTQGLLELVGQNAIPSLTNDKLLKLLFPDSFQTEAEAVDLANQDFKRQYADFSKNTNVDGFNKRFSRDVAARVNKFAATGGGISKLNDGGFVNRDGPINGPGTGTSDDIPAMLSDGEFVMTAEAVRNAGGGSRKKGTEVMYGIMNNLENGGRA